MLVACLLVIALIGVTARATAAEMSIPESTVGLPVELNQLVLPGPELEPVPLDDKMPVVIRIDAVYPHGSDFRYDMVVSALEPGTYDLRDYLQRKDGSPLGDLPELEMKVNSLLPAGQIQPHEPFFEGMPWLGGYQLTMIALGVVWVVGLVALLWPRRKAKSAAASTEAAAPQSLADRLRPLVGEAIAGRLAPAQLAELERALIAFWRRRKGLQTADPTDVIARLRQDEEAAPLLSQLEFWLHRPRGNTENVDANSLLAPYRDLPPESLEGLPQLTGGPAR